jgi:hypothetical protein
MKLYGILAVALLACAPGAGESKPRIDAPAAFARLKTLVGHWEGNTSMGKAQLTYELTAGGHTLVERESAEKMPPMMTLYHLDGDRLLLTHYCMAGNQPRMQATAYDAESGEIEFSFLDATNLQPGAGHMHNARLRLAGSTQLESAWTFYENGRPKATERFAYTRVK